MSMVEMGSSCPGVLFTLYFPLRSDQGVAMEITTDYIKLDSFLKAVSAVGSGGEAKVLIADGEVRVNGEVELRRGRKLRPGDVVEFAGHRYTVEGEVA